jgi:hypothetical protein
MPPGHSDENGPSDEAQPSQESSASVDDAAPTDAAASSDVEATPEHDAPADVEATSVPAEPAPDEAEAAHAESAPAEPALAQAEAEAAPADAAQTEAAPAQKRRNRGLIITAIGASYLVLAAGTAAAVVAIASPAPVDVAALLSAGASSATASAASTASGSAKASPSASASPSPSPSPSPKSTVVGSVKDGVHSGDLRYFLLPPPDGSSSVQGDPDGNTETLSDVVKEYGGSSDVKSFLSQMGFKGGAQRTYQDSTLGANVSIELLQFGSSDDANNWLQGFQLNSSGWTSFSVPGEGGASAREKNADGLDNLLGVYAEGDTFYEITVYGTQTLPHSDLTDLMTAEHGRLAHG